MSDLRKVNYIVIINVGLWRENCKQYIQNYKQKQPKWAAVNVTAQKLLKETISHIEQ